MRGYKFVDLGNVADAVGRGCLKIGTLRSYADLEGPRQDQAEASTIRHGSLSFNGPMSDDDIAKYENPFIGFPPGARVENLTITGMNIRGPNIYCFCMSTSLDAAPLEPHAAFEIGAIEDLAQYLTKVYGNRLGEVDIVKHVEYRARQGSLFDGSMNESPLVKATSFAHEKEIRALWPNPHRAPIPDMMITPREEFVRLYAQGGITPFVTEEDAFVAGLLSRVY